MEQKQNPPIVEVIDEAECAKRLSVRRETLHRWRRDAGMPFVPLSKGRRPHVRYIWPDVVAWLRSKARGHGEEPTTSKRGRPRNVDRVRKNDGRSP